MKKITAFLLIFSIMFSLAACAPDNKPAEPENTPPAAGDNVFIPEKIPVADPADEYTVTESDSTGVYDETGLYLFAPDSIEDAAYSLIGVDELEEAIAEMSFTVQDGSGNVVEVTYRVQKCEMIDAGDAETMFGTKELEKRESLKISNNITTLRYNDGGEALVYWHSVEAGRNCCAHFSSCEDSETVFLYANLLFALVHSELKPE